MTGFSRACSTRTPRAFIDTSIAPVPRPANAVAAAASGRFGAKARHATPAMNRADDGKATFLAPRLSASLPPNCMDTTAAAASDTNSTASPPSSTPNRSRMAGRVAPKPPVRTPFTANNPATASTDRVPLKALGSGKVASGNVHLATAYEHGDRDDAQTRDRKHGSDPAGPLIAIAR